MNRSTDDDILLLDTPQAWRQAHRILEVLSALSYRAGELKSYLRDIACGVSELLNLDWSVVTLCQNGQERVMASSLDLGEGEHVYSLHGLLTDTVVKTGQTLAVEDANAHPEYGKAPEGYTSYLGVPLKAPQGEVLGTICSFCINPRQFDIDEVRTVELFAERAATAIDNYRLYQQQRQFNEMLEAEVVKQTEELRAAQTQLIERERLAAIGEFAAMIVHEIRNPVTTMTMGLKYFRKVHRAEQDQERAMLALDEADRLQNLLNEILLYAKPQVFQLSKLEVNSLIESMLSTLWEMPEAAGRQIQFTPALEAITIACEAIVPGEVVTCNVEQCPDVNQVCIRIHNGGTPIPSNILPKLMQPFCSTKPGGTGLGLAIVKRIIDAHNGSLSIQSDLLTGTTVQITVPAVAA
jgi:signal transduction histidine kinase